jgi:hypothetical protein
VTQVAPTELASNAFYKHSAPLALRNQGIPQQYRTRRGLIDRRTLLKFGASAAADYNPRL